MAIEAVKMSDLEVKALRKRMSGDVWKGCFAIVFGGPVIMAPFAFWVERWNCLPLLAIMAGVCLAFAFIFFWVMAAEQYWSTRKRLKYVYAGIMEDTYSMAPGDSVVYSAYLVFGSGPPLPKSYKMPRSVGPADSALQKLGCTPPEYHDVAGKFATVEFLPYSGEILRMQLGAPEEGGPVYEAYPAPTPDGTAPAPAAVTAPSPAGEEATGR